MQDDPVVSSASLPAPLRQERILRILADAASFVRTVDLARSVGSSEVTIRQDLAALDAEHRIKRVHGGAVGIAAAHDERPFEVTAVENAAAKRAIARVAAGLVRSGECIVLDVGTTPAAIAEALVARDDLTGVTVVTNSLTTALALERAVPRFTVIVTGGTLRPLQHSLVSPFVGTVLPMLAADIAFIGCTGVAADRGVTNVNLPETEVKRMLAAAARRTVVVADGSKIGRRHNGVVFDLDEVDTFITTSADEEDLAHLRERGLEVVVAGTTEPTGTPLDR